ncbi:lipopolysaccharide biosynthesis protein [Undibacterium sp. CY21W]|uniref:lipopolysaccharide biosynthesis protein n=1 Tax=Undibacterium sp. CY21W TaxID=2762293 RepID=UPI00164A6FA9|nr:lipopolysaccharide biosynthesis protein [Undibacterium sp. CY21W]MBC3928823.1 lipopolysaccharide biosynthesis protein [Undibacterium sp. CY21W]
MSFPKKFLSSSFLSVIDQGMLSALNFCIGALLIRLVDKDDYGLYGQLYAGGLLAGLIVDSWIAGPLTTVASAVHENTRKLLLRRYWQRQIFWTVAMGIAAFLIVEFVPAATHHSNKNWLMAAAFGLYVIGNGLREYGRTVGFIQSDIHSVLRQDLVYVAAVLAGMLSLYLFEVIDVAHVFIVLASASFLCALFGRHRIMDRTATQASQVDAEDVDILHEHQETIRGHGRWAVLGVIVGWLSNYSYVYLSGAWLGLAAIADLNASRLLLMPIPLAVAAWSRVARPEASRLMAEHNWSGLRKLTIVSILGIELVVFAYVGAMLLTLPWLEAYVIGSKYSGLGPLIMLWGGYFAINSVRTIGTSWLMSGGAFRSMFFLGTVTLILVVLITYQAIPYWGAAGAIFALIAVELFETVVVWKYILPALQKHPQPQSPA